MKYYTLKMAGLVRELPVVSLKKGLKVASVNLLGDGELVGILAEKLAKRIAKFQFDFLIGPEVKVVPLLEELSRLLGKKRYIVCRKEIHGYMVSPVRSETHPMLVIDGQDALRLRGKKVVVVDDVVSSGKTMEAIAGLMAQLDAAVAAKVSLFKQGDLRDTALKDLIYLKKLPVFAS